jgi:hypothetical protein
MDAGVGKLVCFFGVGHYMDGPGKGGDAFF